MQKRDVLIGDIGMQEKDGFRKFVACQAMMAANSRGRSYGICTLGRPQSRDDCRLGERTNWHNERGYGKVSRTVTLPETGDPETIEAELNNGVLHVTISKLPQAQPKRIDVRVA
jgi:Hsp20/alpha crystallin family